MIKTGTNVKFSLNLSDTNSKKSMCIIHKRCYFHSWKLKVCIIYRCVLYMTYHGIFIRLINFQRFFFFFFFFLDIFFRQKKSFIFSLVRRHYRKCIIFLDKEKYFFIFIFYSIISFSCFRLTWFKLKNSTKSYIMYHWPAASAMTPVGITKNFFLL